MPEVEQIRAARSQYIDYFQTIDEALFLLAYEEGT